MHVIDCISAMLYLFMNYLAIYIYGDIHDVSYFLYIRNKYTMHFLRRIIMQSHHSDGILQNMHLYLKG